MLGISARHILKEDLPLQGASAFRREGQVSDFFDQKFGGCCTKPQAGIPCHAPAARPTCRLELSEVRSGVILSLRAW